MTTFKTSYEQQKWDTLMSAESASLNRIKTGTGTPQDFKKVQALVSKYDTLASRIFKKGVESIEAAANATVTAIQRDREAKSKPSLSEEVISRLMEVALKRAWDDQGPELVVVIEESVHKALVEQDERTSSMFSNKLSEFFGDRDSKETQGLLPDGESEIPEEEIEEESSANKLKFALMVAKKVVKELVEENSSSLFKKVVGAFKSFRKKDDEEAKTSGYNPSALLRSKLASEMVPDSVILNTTPRLESTISNAIAEEESSNNTLEEEIKKATDSNRKKKEDDSRASIWWRKLKGWGGGTFAKAKGAALGLGAGLMVLAGKYLLTQLMGGTLWERISSFLSSDKLKVYSKDFMDFLSEGGKSIATWIANKINPANESNEDTIQKVTRQLVKQDSDITNADKDISRYSHMLEANPNNLNVKRNLEKAKARKATLEAGKQNLVDTATTAQVNISSGVTLSPGFSTDATEALNNTPLSFRTTDDTTVSNDALSSRASGHSTIMNASPSLGANGNMAGHSMQDLMSGQGNTSINGASFIFPKGEALPAPGAAQDSASNSNRPHANPVGAPISGIDSITRGSSIDGMLSMMNIGMLTS